MTPKEIDMLHLLRFKISNPFFGDNKGSSDFINFLRNCPNFLDNCASINWDTRGPCAKCYEQKNYNVDNAQMIKSLIIQKEK